MGMYKDQMTRTSYLLSNYMELTLEDYVRPGANITDERTPQGYSAREDRKRLVRRAKISYHRYLCLILPAQFTSSQMGEIAKGLAYLHSNKVTHGDIKDVRASSESPE